MTELDWLYTIGFVSLGLILGSFLHVVGVRLPKGEPFANDRSGCPHCGHTLSWYELIPVLSYVIQGGKCRGCQGRISIRYPLAELVTGGLYGASYVAFGMSAELVVSLLLVSMLVILFVSDVLYMLLPDKVLLFFAPLLLVALWFTDGFSLLLAFSGALLGGGIVALVILVSNGGMGAGDMKLFLVLGMVFGPMLTLFTFGVSCIVAAIFGVGLLLAGKLNRKEPFPFGPFIVLTAVLAHFAGAGFMTWYFGLF